MTEKPPLTKRQQDIFAFIKDKIVDRGYGPTVREIREQFGIRSPNAVVCHLNALEKKGVITRKHHRSRAVQLAEDPQNRMSMHLAGQISLGHPLETLEEDEDVDFSPLFDFDNHFCLRVNGETLTRANMANGDYVVVRRQTKCQDGALAIVSIDGKEPALMWIQKDKNRIRLEPLNAETKPVYSNDVRVLGVVVGMLRNY